MRNPAALALVPVPLATHVSRAASCSVAVTSHLRARLARYALYARQQRRSETCSRLVGAQQKLSGQARQAVAEVQAGQQGQRDALQELQWSHHNTTRLILTAEASKSRDQDASLAQLRCGTPLAHPPATAALHPSLARTQQWLGRTLTSLWCGVVDTSGWTRRWTQFARLRSGRCKPRHMPSRSSSLTPQRCCSSVVS